MNLEEANRQIEHLKQAIARSEAAISALQNLIRVADIKMKAIQTQAKGFDEPSPSNFPGTSTTTEGYRMELKMFH